MVALTSVGAAVGVRVPDLRRGLRVGWDPSLSVELLLFPLLVDVGVGLRSELLGRREAPRRLDGLDGRKPELRLTGCEGPATPV